MRANITVINSINLLLLFGVILCSGDTIIFQEKYDLSKKSPSITIDMQLDYNDDVVPDYIKNTLANVTLIDDYVTNAYNKSEGSPRLRKAIALVYSKLIKRKLNWEKEVITTVGGTEALFTTIRALTSVGDEWIIIEPFYPAFRRQVELANAVPRFTNLKLTRIHGNISASDWTLDTYELESLINEKTRGILFNNPNNPLGKNYDYTDLQFIAHLAKKHDLIVISDEVHEFATDRIIRMATLPGMFERTVTIGSASKAFGVAGWRVGWVYGPAKLIEWIEAAHADVVGFTPMPSQEAVSIIFENEVEAFESPLSFFPQNLASVKRKRDFIVQAFRDAGMQPIVPQAGHCMLVGWPKLRNKKDIISGSNFADWLSTATGVKAFNAGNYYSEQHRHLGENHLRFCFYKSDKTLRNAAKNLLKLRHL